MGNNQHNLVNILSTGSSDEATVVRWCCVCGGIVVDIDVDGRTSPGAVMKMKIPNLTMLRHCRAQPNE